MSWGSEVSVCSFRQNGCVAKTSQGTSKVSAPKQDQRKEVNTQVKMELRLRTRADSQTAKWVTKGKLQ